MSSISVISGITEGWWNHANSDITAQKPLQSLKCYKHQIITAIKFIPAIKAITSIASIETIYNEYLDNALNKSAELYKAADQVYGIQWKDVWKESIKVG